VARCTCIRLLANRPDDAVQRTLHRQDEERPLEATARPQLLKAHQALEQWAIAENQRDLVTLAQRYAELGQGGTLRPLPGPTGERNTYALLPRERVLCLADNETDALTQLAAVLAVGSSVLWPEAELQRTLYRRLPAAVQASISFSKDWQQDKVEFDAAIYHGDADQLRTLCEQIAQRSGAIVSVQGFAHGETNILLERLLIERSLSVNTAAAGGNASLMTIG
jgi:RHH-type transcriptional regulator, proline utilization regulon repressor / proline dehydrogenase / delta 1-pyrroline-5-carboxylate dehydrogenase